MYTPKGLSLHMHSAKVFVLLFLFSLGGEIAGQIDFENYQPATSSGDVPYRLKETSAVKARKQIDEINRKDARRSQKRLEREHAIQVNFLEDELLTSGQTLYGETMSDYVQKVGLKVLERFPENREKLQFYVLRSHEPNAYTTSNGLVFVSVGLLSRLENEAQLAVVLAHEIQHFLENHSLISYKGMVGARLNPRGESIEKRLSLLYRFSQEQEIQADELGFKMLWDSPYDISQGIRGLKLLKYADYSFLETPWDIDSIFGPFSPLQSDLKNRILNVIDRAEEKNNRNDKNELLNANRTHPQTDYRVLLLKNKLEEDGYSSGGKSKFVQPKEEFDQVQKIARHELMVLLMRSANYGRALYLSRVFELLYGPSPFISRVKTMSIYALTHHRLLKHKLKDYGCDALQNRGEWRKLTVGLKELSPKALSALSLKVIWEEKVRYPKDEFIRVCWEKCLDLSQSKAFIDLYKLLDYKPLVKDTSVQILDSATVVEIEVSQLKSPGSEPNMIEPQNMEISTWYNGVFYGLDSSDILNRTIKNWLKTYNKNRKPVNKDDWGFGSSSQMYVRNRYDKINSDFTGLLLLQPRLTYRKVSATGLKERNYLIEEKSKFTLYKAWDDVIKESKFPVKFLKNQADQKLTTAHINVYSRAKDWLMERVNNDTHSMILFNRQFIPQFSTDRDFSLLGWTSYDFEIQRRPFDISGLLTSIMFPPYAPFFLYRQSQSDAATRQMTYVYNLNTGRRVFMHTRARRSKWHRDMLRAHVYETIYQIAHARNLR